MNLEITLLKHPRYIIFDPTILCNLCLQWIDSELTKDIDLQDIIEYFSPVADPGILKGWRTGSE